MSRQRWRPIPGYEGHYEASNDGRIRSTERRIVSHEDKRVRVFKSRILRPEIRHGYHVVNLSKDGIRAKFYVHRLILLAFYGEPEPGAECCHCNGIRDDNRIQNLRWDTHGSNMRDAVDHGTHWEPNGRKTHCDRGHPFDNANTLVRPNGRACRECIRMKERERYHRGKHGV